MNNNSGFSLIEAVVALGIFSLLAASVAGMAGLTYLSERQGGERTVAQAYAVEGMEAVKAIRARGWSEIRIGQFGLSKGAGYWELSGSEDTFGKYTRQVLIEEANRDVSGEIVEVGGSLDQHTKKVTVTIDWELSPGSNNQLQLTQYFTNWSSLDFEQTDWSGGDGQVVWSQSNMFWQASEGIDYSTAGEIKLNTAGTLPSPYVLLMHLDGARYNDIGVIDNNSFENFIGTYPNINWTDWDEIRWGTNMDSVQGNGEGLAAKVEFLWPLAIGSLYQGTIPIDGDTTYQLSFYVKGDISYFSFMLRDEDYYYLRSDGSFSWWINTVPVPISGDWSQFSIVFTARGNADYLYLTFDGWTFDGNQHYIVDDVTLSQEIVYDESSYNNNGYKKPDDNDGPDYVIGNFSQALDFDGVGGTSYGDYVLVPNSDSLDITGPITIEAWINPDSLGGGDYYPIVTKWRWSGGDYRSYRLTINPSKKLEFFISSDGQAGSGHTYSVASQNQLSIGEWQQVVGVYDGSEIRVYINGEFENSTSYDQGIFSSGSNADVLIGSIDKNLHDDYRFNGKIDEVSIEMVALGDTEVNEHFLNSPLDPESVIVWTAPVPVSIFMADKKVGGMHIKDNYLFLALLDKKRVEVFDLSTNPANPTSLGIFDTVQKSEDVFSYNNYIYVMTNVAAPGIEVYYYESNPVEASQVATMNLSNQPSGLWIEGTTLFISLTDNSVAVYDLLASPIAPALLGSFSTVQNTSDITIYDDYAYVTLDNTSQALQTFDISIDPANPSSTDIKTALEEPIGITTREGYLFMVTKGATRKVLVYNIGDTPSAPATLGDFDIADNGWDVATRGSYIYVGLGGSSKGVQVFDMTFMLAGGSGQTNYEVYGTLESSAIDSGGFSGYNFISWGETLPSAEENIMVQIKTADLQVNLESAVWAGPLGAGSFYDGGNETIIPAPTGHNGDQWFKYLIHLYGSGDDTPVLNGIKINYSK